MTIIVDLEFAPKGGRANRCQPQRWSASQTSCVESSVVEMNKQNVQLCSPFDAFVRVFFRKFYLQLMKLGVDAPRIAIEDRHRAGNVEAGFAGITGVEVKRLADVLVVRTVRMAEHNDVGFVTRNAALGDIRKTVDINDVVDKKLAFGKFDDFRFAVAQTGVIVAEDGGDGSD